jgi:elongation factor P
MQYLFHDGDAYTFMDQESFEQITVGRDLIGDAADFLTDNMVCTVNLIESEVVGIDLPQSTVCTVVEADAVVKGQTASSSYKPAVLNNGVKIMVPPFIAAGTRIVVNIEERTYLERAKE